MAEDRTDLEDGSESSHDSPIQTDSTPIDTVLVQDKLQAASENLDKKGGLALAISKLMNFFKDRLSLGQTKGSIKRDKKDNYWLDDDSGAYEKGGQAVMSNEQVQHLMNQSLQKHIGGF